MKGDDIRLLYEFIKSAYADTVFGAVCLIDEGVIGNPLAQRAVTLPMAPSPMIPIVFPFSSIPVLRTHSPFLVESLR